MANEVDKIVYKLADLLNRRNDYPFLQEARDSAWRMRETFLRQDFNKNLLFRPSSIQDLGNIPLVRVVKGESMYLGDKCKVKRTEVPIPDPIETDFHNILYYVGTVDGSPAYQPVDEFTLENEEHFTYPNLYPTYLYKHGYIYTFEDLKGHINVRTMFRYPEQAALFAKYPNSKCSIETSAYLPGDMSTLIEQEIFKQFAPNVKPTTDEIKL